jgi:hypothetical protein
MTFFVFFLIVVALLSVLWAATTNRPGYEGGTALACTTTSLASGSTRESNTKANPSTTGDFDWMVTLTFTLASGSPSTTNPSVNIYANGSVDATLWPIIQLSSGATAATGAGDASVGALSTVPQLKLIGSYLLQTTTTNAERTFRTQPFSVGAGFGTMPPAFSILIENQTGVAFSSSTATTAQYLEINGAYSSSGN